MAKAIRVLIVDDAEEDARRIVAQLREGGYEPVFERVQSEAELAVTLPRLAWDVLITDHELNGRNAHTVLEMLRARGVDVPVIVVVSGTEQEEELVSLMRAGARDCLVKGKLGRLAAAVDRELREAEVRRGQREAEERYRALIEEIPALTYMAWADELGTTMYVSPQLAHMTGFSPAEWLAEPDFWAKRLHPEDRERVLGEYREAWTTGKPFVSEYRVLDRESRVVWWRDEGRVLRGSNGRAQFVRGFRVDISDRRRAEETIRYMTYHDQLTGLPNRALLLERVEAAVTRGRSEGKPLALLIMALDRFREVTNTLGQKNGDRVIKELVRRLGDVLGEADHVARLRGDEFAILLPEADAALARQVAAKVLRALEPPFMVEKLPIEIGAHIGVSVGPEHGEETELLLQRADVAMQAARRTNSDCVVYSPECDPYDPRRLVLLGELRRAIEADQLLLHYQPKVDLKTRKVLGTEALVRWRHPKHGMVPPDRFIPLAEQGGLIKPLTRWVVGQAVTQCQTWAREGRGLPVAVNLSVRNLQDPQLVEQIVELLHSRGVPAEMIQLELTESAVMADPARAAETLCCLRAQGIKVAIDDFGTGYSSLAYLRRLPVSELKIDKSFVIGMAADGDDGSGDRRHENEDTVIVRSTNDLGHNLGLVVVAEGVEDQRTFERLASFGCDAAQGYHIARPMPPADLGRWLAESPWGIRPS